MAEMYINGNRKAVWNPPEIVASYADYQAVNGKLLFYHRQFAALPDYVTIENPADSDIIVCITLLKVKNVSTNDVTFKVIQDTTPGTRTEQTLYSKAHGVTPVYDFHVYDSVDETGGTLQLEEVLPANNFFRAGLDDTTVITVMPGHTVTYGFEGTTNDRTSILLNLCQIPTR